MSALICGSIAFDTIMVFNDRFKNHILPDKVHILNVSFLVPELRREFGGCAGNIAYNLALLAGNGFPMGTVGDDFGAYKEWLEGHGVDTKYIKVIAGSYSGQAFITTDLDDNQITAFHPGAMNFSHEMKVSDAPDTTIGIVSPDGREGMLSHATQFAELGIPFIFDPGQGMPMFDGEELLDFVEKANWVILNDYEAELLQERTGKSLSELAERVEALIITLGSKGSHIYTSKREIDIPVVSPNKIADPTGCGDAYRAGILYGLMQNMDWETSGRTASLMASIKIEQNGTQNHKFTKADFDDKFKTHFDYSNA